MRRREFVFVARLVAAALVVAGCAPPTPTGPAALPVGRTTPISALAIGASQDWSFTTTEPVALGLALFGDDSPQCPDLSVVDRGGVRVHDMVGCGASTVPLQPGAYTVRVTARTAVLAAGVFTLTASRPVDGPAVSAGGASSSVPALLPGQTARLPYSGSSDQRTGFLASGPEGLELGLRQGDALIASGSSAVPSAFVTTLPFSTDYMLEVTNSSAYQVAAGTSSVVASLVSDAGTLATASASPALGSGGGASWAVNAPGSQLAVTTTDPTRCFTVQSRASASAGIVTKGCGWARVPAPPGLGTVEIQNLGTGSSADSIVVSVLATLDVGTVPASGVLASPTATRGQTVAYSYTPSLTGSQTFTATGTESGCRTITVSSAVGVIATGQNCDTTDVATDAAVTTGTTYTVEVADDSDSGLSGVLTLRISRPTEVAIGALAAPASFTSPALASSQRANWTYTSPGAQVDQLYLAAQAFGLAPGACARIDAISPADVVTPIHDICGSSQFETAVSLETGAKLRVAPLGSASLPAGAISFTADYLSASAALRGVAGSAAVTAEPIAPPTAAPSAVTGVCAPVLYLGAAGSGELEPSQNPGVYQNMGREVYASYLRVREQFGVTPPANGAGRWVEPMAVNYPAEPAGTLFTARFASFFDSISAGVAAAKSQLRERAGACPTQRIVLGGFSQGAMVMHRVLLDLAASSPPGSTEASIVSRIDGAFLLADGDRRAGIDKLFHNGSAGKEKSDGVSWSLGGGGSFSNEAPRAAPLRSSWASGGDGSFNFPIVSYCNRNDAVCTPPQRLLTGAIGVLLGPAGWPVVFGAGVDATNSIKVHTSYTTSEIQAATAAIARNTASQVWTNLAVWPPVPPPTTVNGVSIRRVSVSNAGVQAAEVSYCPSVSADGRFVAFVSRSSNLVPGDTNNAVDVFVRDLSNGTTSRVSVDSNEVQQQDFVGDFYESACPALSSDGRYVAFAFPNYTLTPEGTGYLDVLVRDRTAGTTESVAIPVAGFENGIPDAQFNPSISDDGRYVAFNTRARLTPGSTGGGVYVRDRVNGSTTLLATGATSEILGDPSMSSDGRYVAFRNDAGLVLLDRATATTRLIASSSNQPQFESLSLSADGTTAAFLSNSSTLVANDSNGSTDAFVWDRTTGATRRVSESPNGTDANRRIDDLALSRDGRFLAFSSFATNLVPSDTNEAQDVFLRDLSGGSTRRISVGLDGSQLLASSYSPSISSGGGRVAFASDAVNLVASDTNLVADVFVRITTQ